MTYQPEEEIQEWADTPDVEGPDLDEPDLETTSESADDSPEPEEAPSTVTIGGQEYAFSDLEEIVAASTPEFRQKAQIADALEAALAKDPEAAIKLLAQTYGVTLGGQETMDTSTWEEEPTPNEVLLRKQLDQVSGTLAEIRQHLADQHEQVRVSSAVQNAVESIEQEYGVAATPKQIQQAMQQTGIKDPEAAWLKVNAKTVVKAQAQNAAQSAGRPKPVLPSDGGKTFDPEKVSPTEFVAKMRRGEIPTGALGEKLKAASK